MSDKEFQLIEKKLKAYSVKVIVTVIAGFTLTILGMILTSYGQIYSNKKDIEILQESAVHQEKFNSFLRIQQEYNLLMKDRMKNNESSIIDVNLNLTVLETKMDILLKDYNLRTRDGGKIKLGLISFIEPAKD